MRRIIEQDAGWLTRDSAACGEGDGVVPRAPLDGDLGPGELHQPGRVGEGRRGVIGEGDERTTKAHAAGCGIREAEFESIGQLLRRGTPLEEEAEQQEPDQQIESPWRMATDSESGWAEGSTSQGATLGTDSGFATSSTRPDSTIDRRPSGFRWKRRLNQSGGGRLGRPSVIDVDLRLMRPPDQQFLCPF